MLAFANDCWTRIRTHNRRKIDMAPGLRDIPGRDDIGRRALQRIDSGRAEAGRHGKARRAVLPGSR